MQASLSAPDITCDHCVATIQRVVDGIEGARFISGDPASKSFVVEVASGATLDRVSEGLAAEGYPLGDAAESTDAASVPGQHDGRTPDTWTPAYRVTATPRGADVNYDCDCGCDAGFALDRSVAEQPLEDCCCGKQMLVGRDADARLRGAVGDGHRIDLQTVTMPWGQPIQAALAIPRD